jgi:hypothetical protein
MPKNCLTSLKKLRMEQAAFSVPDWMRLCSEDGAAKLSEEGARKIEEERKKKRQNERNGCRDFPETERGRHNKFLCCICEAFVKMNGIVTSGFWPVGTRLFKLVVFQHEIQM